MKKTRQLLSLLVTVLAALTLVMLMSAAVFAMTPMFAFAEDAPAHNYIFDYKNADYGPFDSYSSDYAGFIKSNLQSKYCDKDYEKVWVTNFTDNYRVQVECDETITYEDLIGKDGILTKVYDNNGLKKPDAYFGAGMKASITDYTNLDELYAEGTKEAIPESGLQFYALEGTAINFIELTVKAPVCGTKVACNEDTGFPNVFPDVTFRADASFSIAKENNTEHKAWVKPDVASIDDAYLFTGTIKGGEEYGAMVALTPNFGAVFGKGIAAEYVKVNGENAIVADKANEALYVIGKVTAQHNWDAGKVTKKPTLKATGVKTYTCKGCGEKKTSTIAKLKANTLKVTAKTATVKYSKLKKKTQTVDVKKVLTVSKAKGTLKYKKTGGNKKITINSKTGKVTVKKGLKKGTYKIKVKVTAAGTSTYGAKSITKTFKIRVK